MPGTKRCRALRRVTRDAGRRGSPFVYDPFGSVVRQDVVGGEATVRFLTIPATATTDRAVYTHQTETGDAQIAEWSILSADRLGVDRTTQAVSEAVTSGDIHYRHIGSTLYELTDQVGSVRAVISDVVDPDPNNPGRFQARVLSRSDYEPYGARRTKRFIDLESAYRYGWQGMRLLDGVDQRVDYVTPFRLYDVRVGRWTSSDPLFDPSASSYEGLWSNPLAFTDPLGLVPGGENGASDKKEELSNPLAPNTNQSKATIRSDDRSTAEKLVWQYAIGLWNGGLNEYYDNFKQVVDLARQLYTAVSNMSLEDWQNAISLAWSELPNALSAVPGLLWEGIKTIPDVFGDAVDDVVELARAGTEVGDVIDVARGKVSMYEAAERKGRRDAMRIKLLVEYALLRGGGRAFSAAIRYLPRAVRVAAWNVLGRIKRTQSGVSNVARKRAVIGKLDDLGALQPNEYTLLDRLPDQGNPKANWRQNARVLREEMNRGEPIRDASVDANGLLLRNKGFLKAERELLRNHGWIYNPKTTLWYPPAQ